MMHPPLEAFANLAVLLKLKRYELPPPGYFHGFSAQVIARIEVLSERQPTRLKRIWAAIEARPAVIAVGGVATWALLVAGFVMVQQTPDDLWPSKLVGGRFMELDGQNESRHEDEASPPWKENLWRGSGSLSPASLFTSVNYW